MTQTHQLTELNVGMQLVYNGNQVYVVDQSLAD